MLPCVIPVQPNTTPGPGPPSPVAVPAPTSAHAIAATVRTPRRISASCQLSSPVRRRRCEESLRVLHGAEDAEALSVYDEQRPPMRSADDQVPAAVCSQPVVEHVLRRGLPRKVD